MEKNTAATIVGVGLIFAGLAFVGIHAATGFASRPFLYAAIAIILTGGGLAFPVRTKELFSDFVGLLTAWRKKGDSNG